jgi:hypothetical protein
MAEQIFEDETPSLVCQEYKLICQIVLLRRDFSIIISSLHCCLNAWRSIHADRIPEFEKTYVPISVAFDQQRT